MVSKSDLSTRKGNLMDLEVIKGSIVLDTTNVLKEVEIPLPSIAVGRRRMALEIWGFMIAWAVTGGGTLGFDVNNRFSITTKSRDNADPPLPHDADVVMFHEQIIVVNDHDGGAGFALSTVHYKQGMPEGLWPVPITVAADKLFAQYDTSNWIATPADVTFTLYVRPIEVSLEQWLDLQETFK